MFDLNEYEPVESRIKAFWDKFPDGRLHTELVHFDDKQFIVKAMAFTDRTDTVPAAIDFAQEIVGNSPVNKNFSLENCATSALGRCLSTLGFSPKGKRPSREEMAKVVAIENYKKENPLNWGNDEVPTPPEPTEFDPFQEWPAEQASVPMAVRITEPNFRAASIKQINFLSTLFMQQSHVDRNLMTDEGRLVYCQQVIGKEIKSVADLSSKECSAIIKSLQRDQGVK